MRVEHGIMYASVLALTLLTAPSIHAQTTLHFDLPAQPLAVSLRAIGSQTSTNVLFDAALVQGRQARALKAELRAADAFSRLLEGTGLTHRFLDEKTVTVTELRDKQAPAGVHARGNQDADSSSLHGSTTAGSTSTRRAGNGLWSRFRLAQVHTDSPSTDSNEPSSRGNGRTVAQSDDEVEEIIVTGTHIRGAASAGSKVVTIDRDYIERSGYATVQDALKTLPQNFGGGVTEDFTRTGNPNFGNYTGGNSVNLRGLGADSTLLLVNGRRQPLGGIDGFSVDVSSIASTAVKRVEVLTDGASAIYGSDAVGGVVNVVLRRDFNGAETRARMGTLGGDSDEIQLSQLFGRSWTDGHVIAGYQFYEREALPQTDRQYAADTNQARQGGSNFSSTSSSPGNILSPTTALPVFAIPSGQDGRSLITNDLLAGQVNFQNGALGRDVLAEQQTHSAFFDASRNFLDWVELFAEGRYASRDMSQRIGGDFRTLTVPSSNPFFVDPFGGRTSINVAYNFLNDLGPITGTGNTETYTATLGAKTRLPHSWQVALAGSYGRERTRWDGSNEVDSAALAVALADTNPATAFNPFGDGGDNNPATLDAIRRIQRERAESDIWSANLTADGPLFSLPGGLARLAIGADYRAEGLFAGTILRVPSELGREVSAAFAELALPLVGEDNARPGLERLALSLAGRFENYSDFGDTLNPKAGLSWSPLPSLAVRATWGTSFKAPTLISLREVPRLVNGEQLLSILDPQSSAPNGRSSVIFRFGNNQNLKEETADIWTAGIDLTPAMVPGLVLSLSYYDIAYKDRIVSPGPTPRSTILLVEDQWAEVITRNPSQSEVDEICNGPTFLNPPASCMTTPPVAIIDLRLRNLSAINVRGIDFDALHTAETRYGTFQVGIASTYVLSFERAVTDTSPVLDVVDTLNNPLSLRARASLSWSRGAWDINATANYEDSYSQTLGQSTREIESWKTLDMHLGYRLPADKGWLDDTRLSLNAVNVFDEDPPFADVALGYDAANVDPLGRMLSIELVKVW